MYAEIQKLLNLRSQLLCEEKFDELAEFYQEPFVSYHDGFPAVMRNRSQTASSLRKVASKMASRGAVRIDTEVLSLEMPRSGRFRMWSCYQEIDRSGNVISQSEVLQYLVDTPQGPLVEMIEAHDCPLAEASEHLGTDVV